MKHLADILDTISSQPISILDSRIPLSAYTPLDLSMDNPDLEGLEITDPNVCQAYIDRVLRANKAQVAFGGYLERRALYGDKASFSGADARNLHLGVDFWAPAGTTVLTPISGSVHSFQNNATVGDYGPTIILEHTYKSITFYTLYGHLAVTSIETLQIGQMFAAGSVLATLGKPDINVNYAPHLHFQVIMDMKGNSGDYPGVCSDKTLPFYRENCPDPDIVLQIRTAENG